MFCYAGDSFGEFHEFHYDPSCRKGTKVSLIKDGEIKNFNSINKAKAFLNVKISGFVDGMVIKGYTIKFLEGVSTITDECK